MTDTLDEKIAEWERKANYIYGPDALDYIHGLDGAQQALRDACAELSKLNEQVREQDDADFKSFERISDRAEQAEARVRELEAMIRRTYEAKK